MLQRTAPLLKRNRVTRAAVLRLILVLTPLYVISIMTEAGLLGNQTRIIYPLTLIVTNLVILVRLWVLTVRHQGRVLLGRICIALMSTLSLAAVTLWIYVYPDGAMRDAVELPEVLYLGTGFLAWAGFAFLHLSDRRSRRFDLSVFLDVALMAASGFALAWHFVIEPYSQSLVPGLLPSSIVDVSPYVQVSLFALAAQVLLQRSSRLPSRLFGIAILLIMFADALLAMVVKDAMRLNTGMTALWTTGTALLTLDAGRAPLPPERRRVNLFGVQRPDRVPGLRILPYVVGGSSVAVITFHVHLPWADTLARQQGFMLSTVVLGLLVLRQMLMLLENQRLGRQLIAANRELHHKATHDDLTGLLNHGGFNTQFKEVLYSAARNDQQLALFVFDFDSFKQVNDEHGHVAGDELLRAAGKRIHSGLAEGQHAARLGGDEFLLLAPVSGAPAAEQYAQQLAERLMQPYRLSQSNLILDQGISIGFSLFPADGTDVATLLRAADRAMYRNKRRRTRVNS